MRTFVLALLLFNFSVNLVLKAQSTHVTITPQESSRIISEKGIGRVLIFKVGDVERTYQALKSYRVENPSYTSALERELFPYEDAYLSYKREVEVFEETNQDYDYMIDLIKKYISSDERKSVRKEYLIEAQKEADSRRMKIVVKDWSGANKVLKIYDSESYSLSTKRDLESCIEFIENQKKQNPKGLSRHYEDYKKYQEILENPSTTIPKTIEKRELSDSTYRAKTYGAFADNPISIESFEGTFTKLESSDSYYLVLEDFTYNTKDYSQVEQYFSGDLILSNTPSRFGLRLLKDIDLIKDVNTNETYVIANEDFFDSYVYEQKGAQLVEYLQAAGYNVLDSEGGQYVQLSSGKLKLNPLNLSYYEEHPNYIKEMERSYSTIKSLVKQTPSHTSKLNEYINLYRMKGALMPTSKIEEWKQATLSAKKLNDQIYKLMEPYEGDYSYVPDYDQEVFNNYLDSLLASKGVLGI